MWYLATPILSCMLFWGLSCKWTLQSVCAYAVYSQLVDIPYSVHIWTPKDSGQQNCFDMSPFLQGVVAFWGRLPSILAMCWPEIQMVLFQTLWLTSAGQNPNSLILSATGQQIQSCNISWQPSQLNLLVQLRSGLSSALSSGKMANCQSVPRTVTRDISQHPQWHQWMCVRTVEDCALLCTQY